MANVSLFCPIEVSHPQNDSILVEDTLLSPEPPSNDPKILMEKEGGDFVQNGKMTIIG